MGRLEVVVTVVASLALSPDAKHHHPLRPVIEAVQGDETLSASPNDELTRSP